MAGFAGANFSGGTLSINTYYATLELDEFGNFTFKTDSGGTGIALKAGGGPWASISDARVKTVEEEYEVGLAAVCALRPVVYHYNSGVATSFVGLVAQEVEEFWPDMVRQTEGLVNGEKVDDLRTLDTSELIFALVNCVKQLKARIEALEAR